MEACVTRVRGPRPLMAGVSHIKSPFEIRFLYFRNCLSNDYLQTIHKSTLISKQVRVAEGCAARDRRWVMVSRHFEKGKGAAVLLVGKVLQ